MRKREYILILKLDNAFISDCSDISIYKTVDELVYGLIGSFNAYKELHNDIGINFNNSMVILSGRRFSSSRNMIPLNIFLSSVLIQDKDTIEQLKDIGFKRTKKVVEL